MLWKTSQNRARTLMKESTSLKECIEKLNKTGLGGGRLTMQDSHTLPEAMTGVTVGR
ncbi:MAG: hypothetical protein HXS47_12400 [Theionarchaea archaeon]|nr:hypothetical protein [Theionarchaea archaeon]